MPLFSKLFILTRVLGAPLEILFTLLIFILNKNLTVLPLQLTLIACVKPISSLFSFYLSSALFDKPHRTRTYLIFNIFLGALPCFFYPFTDNVWFYIASYALFLITNRALMPAWMEVLKSRLDPLTLAKTVSYGNSIFYFMTIAVSPLICFFMDISPQVWRLLFFSLALLKMINLVLVFTIRPGMKIGERKPFVDPLKKGWKLLRQKPSFAHYLLLYCIGGIGIIGTQPILPIYFKEDLNLSYTALGVAFSCCKGASFLLASPFWVKFTEKFSLYLLNALANMFTVLYFALLLFASYQTELVYLGYISYGIMLAGCELSKDISGPYFSKQQDSTIFSSLNLAAIGIRGCIFPALGTLLYSYTGSTCAFITAALICLLGSVYGLWLNRKYSVPYGLQRSFSLT